MSSSGSDDDDSDDELLGGGPTFSKSRAQERKEKASEKKMLGFLDETLAKEKERAERNERIATMMREQAEQQARAAAAVAGDGDDGDDEADGAADAGAAAELATGGGSNNSDSTASASGASSSVRSSAVKKKKKKTATTTYDDNDPEYWKRIKKYRGDVRGSGAEGRAKRRREIDDEVDGVNDLSDEEGDGGPEDLKRRKALASAMATGLSTGLGARRMFLAADGASADDNTSSTPTAASAAVSSDPENVDPRSALPFVLGSMKTFASSSDALMELKTIVDALTKSAGKKGTTEQKRVEREIRDSVLKSFKSVSEGGSIALSEFLSQGTLSSRCSEASLPVPRELIAWLFTAACSGSTTRMLALGAYQTLMEIMKAQLMIIEFGRQENEEGSDGLKIAHMSDLIPGLERLFRLWTQGGPSPAMNEEPSDDEADEADTTINKKKEKRPRKSFLDNASGLGHFFALWAMALDYDYVAGPAKVKSEENMDAKLAWDDGISQTSTAAIAALAKASLDPVFQSGRHDLNHALKWLVVSLVEYNTLRLGGSSSDTSDEVRRLYSAMAQAISDACSNLSTGLPKSADEDDINGWLPYSLLVRTLPIEHHYDRPSIAALRLKATVAEYALKKCLEYGDDWEGRLENEFKQYSKSLDDKTLSDRWRMMVSSEVGLRKIQSVGGEITNNGPRFLTCVEIAGVCAELGMALFSDVEQSDDGTGGIYKSIDEAGAISQSLESLENLCTQLKKNVTSVFVYPHLRRVKEVLTLLAVYFHHQKDEASEMARHRGEVNLTQKTLGGWFTTSGDSQTQPEPGGDSQEDDTPMAA